MKIFTLILLTPMLVSQQSMAHGSLCPEEATWYEAVAAERTTTDSKGSLVEAKVKQFSNAWLAEIGTGSDKDMLLRMTSGDAAISLTFGRGRPKPIDFAEIGMAVEPPMADGSWPRMKRPCDVEDGGVIAFSEKDLPVAVGSEAIERPRFHGVLKRRGLSFSYDLTAAASAAQPHDSYRGSLLYGRPGKTFDLSTDMKGWHVYRGDTFVRTMPAGERVPLSAVLDEMGANLPQ